jgi:hypothetical protein
MVAQVHQPEDDYCGPLSDRGLTARQEQAIIALINESSVAKAARGIPVKNIMSATTATQHDLTAFAKVKKRKGRALGRHGGGAGHHLSREVNYDLDAKNDTSMKGPIP